MQQAAAELRRLHAENEVMRNEPRTGALHVRGEAIWTLQDQDCATLLEARARQGCWSRLCKHAE
jgi:hypothetical protein